MVVDTILRDVRVGVSRHFSTPDTHKFQRAGILMQKSEIHTLWQIVVTFAL